MALMQVYNEDPEDEPVYLLRIYDDEPPPPKYHYKPLSDPRNFRILCIEPGAPGSRIRASLQESRPGNGVTYLALSYVWGSPQIVAYVMIEDCFALVTGNLYAALQHLRSEQESLWVWTDQICINQQDQEERSQQVMLMHEIFSKSVQVSIWLGKDTQPYEEGVLYILKLLAHTDFLNAQLDDNLVGRVVEFTNSQDVEKLLPSLSALYENRWFSRSWTFQEAVCNPDTGIVFGFEGMRIPSFVGITFEILISFTHLLMGNDIIKLLLPLSHESYRATRQLMVISQYRTSNPGQNLLQLAHSTRDRSATDVRDRLYSLIPVATSNSQQAITPNYYHSTTRVYTEFASTVILESNKLHILEYNGSPAGDLEESDLEDLPSWVPDWSLGWFPLLSSTALVKPYAASKVPDKIGDIQESELIAYGMKADRISTIASESYWPEPEPDQSEIRCLAQAFLSVKEMIEMASLANVSRTTSEEQQNWREALIDSQLRSNDSHKERLLAQIALYVDVLNHRVVGKGDLIPEEELTNPVIQDSFSAIHRQFERMTHAGRKFCTTEAGRLGWASKRAREGDIVALLYGCVVPILLRPRQDGKYECLEACYIKGIMDGEVVEEAMKANGIPEDEVEDETKWKQYAPMERFVIG